MNMDVNFFAGAFLQYEDLESLLRDSGVLAQTQKAQDLEVRTFFYNCICYVL